MKILTGLMILVLEFHFNVQLAFSNTYTKKALVGIKVNNFFSYKSNLVFLV